MLTAAMLSGTSRSNFQTGVQALTMLLAGFETTANTLTFTLYLLARSCNAEKQVAFLYSAFKPDAFTYPTWLCVGE